MKIHIFNYDLFYEVYFLRSHKVHFLLEQLTPMPFLCHHWSSPISPEFGRKSRQTPKNRGIRNLKSGKGVGQEWPLQTTFPFAGLKVEIFSTDEQFMNLPLPRNIYCYSYTILLVYSFSSLKPEEPYELS